MPFQISSGIPDGTFPATLEKVEESNGKFGLNRKWHWLVELPADAENPNARIESLSVYSSGNTGPGSKTYKWLKAILGRDLKAGETIEDPTGTRVLLTITRNEKGFPTIGDDAVMPYSEPQQVLPGVPR